ncbi:capsular exopolysaccharide family [Marvinbryantia formatexigens DSM 14469]|uniref:non-specific protein-tyrosine kinase n=1 Tax=Marvinbryantia formatexigens DSM 14469 TaxID=478749 RepID=C6LCS5_9FIRM|nr:CpsD/CapB family tyrosine-protein kinase [Marvinbryantia formatexigens]EET61739.1 capsular exopolysaccharide family [Marvinbryantia formatexigens DSM 14469]UWO24450.1 CpsD/CapB family tyrosine-protein kinase [Marvinbryantia formatexigens DSM 14469]SDF08277.1 capsular exopolysaccharide family [Marvinbryantia formatexigens]
MANINIDTMTKLSFRVSEAYKSLRTNITFCGKDCRVIAITSCTPNEGKSNVSLNLAASLAETGKKVLFIDADLRKSVLIGRLGVTEKIVGLTNYITGQCEFKEIVCTTNYPSLHIIFPGPEPPNPAELLGSEAFSDMLGHMRENYDYVIIDTPPLGNVIDSAVIAKECDGAAIVIAADAVSYKFVRKVKEQIERSQCRLLGVILNKVSLNEKGYYGKYYGNYYGKD